jgi:hypothetical protein
MMQQRQDISHLDFFGLRHQQSSLLALSLLFLDYNKQAVMSHPNLMMQTSMPENDASKRRANDNDLSQDISNNLVSRRPDLLFSFSAPPKESHTLEPHHRSQSIAFPHKLHDMLNDMNCNGCHHVVLWLPSGRDFKIHDPEMFVASISKCLLDMISNPFCYFLCLQSHTSFLCCSLLIILSA